MSQHPKWEKFLNERRKQMSEGMFNLISWDEIAALVGVPGQTMRNWKNGKVVPAREDDVQKLVKVFGDGVYPALNRLPPDIDPAFLRLWFGAKQDPNQARILQDALDRAREYQTQPTGQMQLSM